MAGRYGSTLSLPQGARKVNTQANHIRSEAVEVTQERTHRPPVGAAKFSQSKASANALKAALRSAEDDCEDLPGDINGNC